MRDYLEMVRAAVEAHRAFMAFLPAGLALSVLMLLACVTMAMFGGDPDWSRGRWADIVTLWKRAWRGDKTPLD